MTKYQLTTMATIVGLGVLLIGIYIRSHLSSQFVMGDFKLVAKYEPLQLHINVDTVSTNKIPDFVIGEGDQPIFYRESNSNGFTITHAEKGLNILSTEYGTHGEIMKRFMNSYYANSSKLHCLYMDTNGDGLFDILITYNKDGNRTAEFVQSNVFWIQVTNPNR